MANSFLLTDKEAVMQNLKKIEEETGQRNFGIVNISSVPKYPKFI